MTFVGDYAVVAVSLPRSGTFDGSPMADALKSHRATSRYGLLIVDLRNGDIVQWFRLRGDITELFDVGVILDARCSRGIGPYAQELEEAMRCEEWPSVSVTV